MLTYSVDVAANAVVSGVVETVVATLGGVTTQRGGQRIEFRGEVALIPGLTVTGFTLAVRRDGLGGAIVSEAITDDIFTAVGGTETHSIVVTDDSGDDLASATYVLTVTQVAATGDGTAVHASLRAEVTP